MVEKLGIVGFYCFAMYLMNSTISSDTMFYHAMFFVGISFLCHCAKENVKFE